MKSESGVTDDLSFTMACIPLPSVHCGKSALEGYALAIHHPRWSILKGERSQKPVNCSMADRGKQGLGRGWPRAAMVLRAGYCNTGGYALEEHAASQILSRSHHQAVLL